MTYDPAIATDLFRGLAFGVAAVVAGLALGLFLIALLPKWDEG